MQVAHASHSPAVIECAARRRAVMLTVDPLLLILNTQSHHATLKGLRCIISVVAVAPLLVAHLLLSGQMQTALEQAARVCNETQVGCIGAASQCRVHAPLCALLSMAVDHSRICSHAG